MQEIEFFFDFSSPYSYLASPHIEPLAAKYGRRVAFKPILLGAAFKVSGMASLVDIPLKGEYSKRDFARSARFAGLPYKFPSVFPISTVNTARALLWLQGQASPHAVPFLHRAFRAFFAEDRNIGDVAVLSEIADELGIDRAALAHGIQDPAIKEQLRALVDHAVSRGVFGAPFMFVDGEPFWGHDRLPQVERWLASGPF
jgi:2-hydroxychromene-2-carboxylate isomerase